MSLNKRIKGDFTIESITTGTKIIMHEAGGVTIDGDLTVSGTENIVDTTNLEIVDNEIILNSGEAGPGITHASGTSGILIDRGDGVTPGQLPAGIRFAELTDEWQLNIGDGVWTPIAAGAVGGINNVVEDTTPQLGGDLDVNGQSITSALASNADVVITADGTGLVKIEKELSLKEQATPAGVAGYNKLSAGTTGPGGTGLYFANDTETDELVSRTKAIIYGIIF